MKKLILISLIILFAISSKSWAEDCSGSDITKWNYCVGTLNFPNGGQYVGEFKSGNYDGQGTYTFANGETYVGEFKGGKYNGKGTLIFSNGGEYVGEFKNEKYNGQGTFTYANGDKYIGEWKNNRSHGQGTYIFANGETYVGEHKNGKRHGQGTISFPNGGEYTGEFKDGKYNGQGTFTYADGRIWQGKWRNDKWVTGKKYATGEKEKKDAESTIAANTTDFSKYKSTCSDIGFTPDTDPFADCVLKLYKRDKVNTKQQVNKKEKIEDVERKRPAQRKGSLTSNSGREYIGVFKDGIFEGMDKRGVKYIGNHKNGKMHGQGTYIFHTGETFVGVLRNGFFSSGTFTYANGDKYIGQFKNDKYHGEGTYIFANGSVHRGQWENGQWITGEKFGNSPQFEREQRGFDALKKLADDMQKDVDRVNSQNQQSQDNDSRSRTMRCRPATTNLPNAVPAVICDEY